MDTKVFKFGRLTLVLDRREVFPDDPGNGTPAIVKCGNYCSTYAAATDQGELLGDRDALALTPTELAWLDKQEGELEAFLYASAS